MIGAGAAGGVMAKELATAGFSVVVLEQGPYLRETRLQARRARDHVPATRSPTIAARSPTRSASANPRRPSAKPAVVYGRMVGGGTVHFTGELLALPRDRLSTSAACSARSPGTGFADWPITYAELEPYYTKAEWEIGVSGLAGASPFDPPRSKPYPMPPLPVKSSGVLFERGARKLGLHPFPAPMAILSQPYRGRRACVHCGFCEGFGCEVRRQVEHAGDRDPGGGADRPLRDPRRVLRAQDRDRRSAAARPARSTSIAHRREVLSGRARWWCAPTAPRRRGCC